MAFWLKKKKKIPSRIAKKDKITSNHKHAIHSCNHPNSCEVLCTCLKAVASDFAALDDNQKQLWHFHKFSTRKTSVYVGFSLEFIISFKCWSDVGTK